MSYTLIHHYIFICDAISDGKLCGAQSPIIESRDLADAARWCEHLHDWRILMGRETPLFTYCPEHKGLAT